MAFFYAIEYAPRGDARERQGDARRFASGHLRPLGGGTEELKAFGLVGVKPRFALRALTSIETHQELTPLTAHATLGGR